MAKVIRREGARGPRAKHTKELSVRLAEAGDEAAIAHLRWLSDAQHAEALPGYFRTPAAGVRPAPRPTPSQPVLVATRGEEVVGYLVLLLAGTPRDPATVPGARARVDALVVAPSARRAGIGKKLIEEASRRALAFGARDLVLTVWSGNDGAEAFYGALGFAPLARVLRLDLERPLAARGKARVARRTKRGDG